MWKNAHSSDNNHEKVIDSRFSILIGFSLILSIPMIFLANTWLGGIKVFECLLAVIGLINILGIGYIIQTLIFSPFQTRNNESNLDGSSFSQYQIFRLLLAFSLGIIFIYIFALITITLLNFLEINDLSTRGAFLIFGFYFIELIFASIYMLKNGKEIIPDIRWFIRQVMKLNKLPRSTRSIEGKSVPNILYWAITLLFCVVIIILGWMIGELNYTDQDLVLMLVYLFFLSVILLLIFYFRIENRSLYFDAIVIFLIVFTLTHMYISRGPTLVGRTDIHKELFHAEHARANLNWNPNEFNDNYGTVLSISLFPMILNLVFGISIITIFEVILPIIFGLFNITNYLILIQLYARENKTYKNPKNRLTSFPVIFGLFSVIFIRSYTHLIAASSRIVIAYFFFAVFCYLVTEEDSEYGAAQIPLLLILLLSTLFSHWGTFLFGIAILLSSIILNESKKASWKYNLYSRLSEKFNRRVFGNYIFLAVFVLISLFWLFFFAPQIMEFINIRILPAISDLFSTGWDTVFQQILSLGTTFRILNSNNPFILLESIVNIVFIGLVLFSIGIRTLRIIQSDNIVYTDFFGFSTLLCMALMFLIPVLSLFYSPLRVGMQFWPYIAPLFIFDFLGQKPSISLAKKPLGLLKRPNYRGIFSVFLFILVLFHQGIMYDLIYEGKNPKSPEVLEVGEGFSLIFRNYGVEAWRWILTDTDLKAIEWLNNQSSLRIHADLSRTYMLYSKIEGLTPEDHEITNALDPLKEFFKTNISEYIYNLRGHYFFISSQNLLSGYMFFSNEGYSTSRLISVFEENNATLIYSDVTRVYLIT